MGEQFVVGLAFVLLNGQQGIGIILQGDELILIELLLLHIVESYNMLAFQVLRHMTGEIGVGKLLDAGGTAGEVVEDIAHL